MQLKLRSRMGVGLPYERYTLKEIGSISSYKTTSSALPGDKSVCLIKRIPTASTLSQAQSYNGSMTFCNTYTSTSEGELSSKPTIVLAIIKWAANSYYIHLIFQERKTCPCRPNYPLIRVHFREEQACWGYIILFV